MLEITPASEVWRSCLGHEGSYEVSNRGRVRSVPRVITRKDGGPQRVPGGLKSLTPGFGGYVMASLWRDNKERKVRIHTLVLEAFAGPSPAGLECRHKDGNPSNNRLSNLEWGTSSENAWDIVRHGNHPAKNKVVCLRGHELVEPNLTPSSRSLGQRSCLACKRARDNQRYAQRMGYVFDLQARADEHYRKIMGAPALPVAV